MPIHLVASWFNSSFHLHVDFDPHIKPKHVELLEREVQRWVLTEEQAGLAFEQLAELADKGILPKYDPKVERDDLNKKAIEKHQSKESK